MGKRKSPNLGMRLGVGKEVNIWTRNSWGTREGHTPVTQGSTEAGDHELDMETTYSMAAL